MYRKLLKVETFISKLRWLPCATPDLSAPGGRLSSVRGGAHLRSLASAEAAELPRRALHARTRAPLGRGHLLLRHLNRWKLIGLMYSLETGLALSATLVVA